MYRTVADFIEEWSASAAGTLSVFQAISDDKMDVAIAEGHNSLGWLAWHLVGSAGVFGQLSGLDVPGLGKGTPVPASMTEVIAKYNEVIAAYSEAAKSLTDEQLLEEINGFGNPLPRGKFLRIMVDHQTHHRGQMTVLLRQAGLSVPGVMGPTKEMQ
ncbi:DinB family protein [Paenibacillus sp. IITD108]|uniref:DinB family protein n=1 Tax=Paenibacillus sp. IITD108 TaxID=3116649 RepID=UPI002F406DD6